ncbi:four-carbon acid sugar kinase family protein [Streptomyces sp. NPDC001868]|uniref:four-carbon acid sugar kinase family protein n=1 Tax=Streptomyces sp. NPDC001868 TaxID=3154401 RepID=UPI003327195E
MPPLSNPLPSVAVLADDLTSAGDGAAPFRRTGHEARILFSEPAVADLRTPGVTAVDLGTRLLEEAEAADRTRQAASMFMGCDVVLKTVDSTLRGHLAAEIRAAWAGSGRRAVVVAPAFPAQGRVTAGGVQYVHGVPVDQSDFAHDPVHPVTCADLAVLLPEAVLVEPDRADGLPRPIADGRLIVCSASTDEELDRFVRAVPRLDQVLWVGSPGLAAALARRCALRVAPPTPTPEAEPESEQELEPARRPLVVVGSANPASRRQLAVLHSRADADGTCVTEDPGEALAAVRRLNTEVLTLRTPDERHDAATAQALAASLAATVRVLADEHTVDALVITGGETAATVFQALGATGITLIDEPEPGVARGTLLGGHPLPVLVKAGGFGDDGTLLRLCHLAGHPLDRGENGPAENSPAENGRRDNDRGDNDRGNNRRGANP